MAFSTSVTLLTTAGAPIQRSMLTYSTSSMTTRTRTAVATPDPDYFGNTNYLNSGSVGVSLDNSSFFVDVGTVTNNRYPNYTFIVSPKPQYMGSYSGTLTPSFKDSGLVDGTTSGPIAYTVQRNFTWPYGESDTFNWNGPAGGVDSICFFFDHLDFINVGRLSGNTFTTFVSSAKEWNTSMAILQNAGLYNEVRFTLNSGTATVVSVNTNLTTVTQDKSFGTWYDVKSVGIKVTPRATSGVNSVWVTAEFRNKSNNAITASHNINLSVSYT